MKIKSLLLGSAVAAVAVTGARAADAIIIAEPEPMEYVRICDVYGAGFFFIPGTDTCLKIGGYVRYEMGYDTRDWIEVDEDENFVAIRDYRFSKYARFAPNFDARSETELGTLRGYAEVEFDWYSYTWDSDVGEGSSQATNLNEAYIELQQANSTIRIGKGDNPYARFLGYGAGGVYGGAYAHGPGFNNSGEVSYTFNNGNGFSAVVAAVETRTGRFEPNGEAGVNFAQGWGSVGAIAGYDNVNDEWGAKVVVRGNLGPATVGLHGFYSSTNGANWYGQPNPQGGTSEWSVLAHAAT